MVSDAVLIKSCIRTYKVLHTDQNNMWIYTDGGTLKLHDEHFNYKIIPDVSNHISNMALTASQAIVATDYHNKCLIKISPSGSIISTLCSTGPLEPRGICINSRQEIVVGLGYPDICWTRQPLPAHLSIYSSDGSTLLGENFLEDSDEFRPVGLITQVEQNCNGDYVVASWNRIECVSSEGRIKWCYDVGSTDSVGGIVCLKNHHVIVADTNDDKILLLNSEGKLVTTLLTEEDGISGPQSLSIDRHGRLWIGQENDIKVVKYTW